MTDSERALVERTSKAILREHNDPCGAPMQDWKKIADGLLAIVRRQEALMREAAALLRQPEVTNAWLDKARAMAARLEGKA